MTHRLSMFMTSAVAVVVAFVAWQKVASQKNTLGLGPHDQLITRVNALGVTESLVVVHNPPGSWRPVDTIGVSRRPPLDPAYRLAGVALEGTLGIYPRRSRGVDSAVASTLEVDSFRVDLPTESSARMTLIVGGARLPLRTERLARIPPWVEGQPPALPGVAWRAFLYQADTLTLWGYNDPPLYVGHLELRAQGLPARTGYWHTFGPPTELPVPLVRRQ